MFIIKYQIFVTEGDWDSDGIKHLKADLKFLKQYESFKELKDGHLNSLLRGIEHHSIGKGKKRFVKVDLNSMQ